MAKLTEDEVKAAVEGWLGPLGQIHMSRGGPGSRITGWIMHPDFKGVMHADRQGWLWNGFGEEGTLKPWKGLRETFKERSSQIGLILTYSPAEYENAFGQSA